jgi:sulfite exporter TauE/SafE
MLAGLTLGLAGGAHCALMCGPLCAACAHAPTGAAMPRLLGLQAGRLIGYATLGVLAGGIGGLLRFGLNAELWLLARSLVALSLIVAGAVLLGWRGPERLAQRALPIWQRCFGGRWGGAFARRPEFSLLLGVAWALLPCGLLYAAVFLTASSGGAAQGALTMTAFGIGTLPAVIASSLGLLQLRRSRVGNRMARPAGIVLAAVGVLALAAPWLVSHDWLGPAAQLLLDCTTPT